MDKQTKKKFLEALEKDPLFQQSLERATDPEERRKIKAFAEDVYLSMITGLLTAKDMVEKNPEKMAEVIEKSIPKE